MFYIIPNVKWEVKSLHKKDLLIEKFRKSVSIVQKLSIRNSNSFHDFEGALSESGFSIRRIFKQGFSAFLPILTCKIHDNENSLNLKINIKFHKYVSIGLSIFFLFQIIFFSFDFTSVAIIIVPYLIIIYLFNMEVKLLKEKFYKIIESSHSRAFC
jgi:hypothetical protein